MSTIQNGPQEPQNKNRPVRAADVAALAGVSRSAVSVVLNGARASTGVSAKARERILKAAAELNYVADPAAQKLAGGAVRPVVAIFNPQIFAGVTLDKVMGIHRALESAGFDAPIYCGDGQEQVHVSALKRIRQQRPEAVLCFTMSQFEGVFSELEQYQREGGTVVCYDYAVDFECDQVVFDRNDNTYQGARALLQAGHRDIGFFFTGALPETHLNLNSRHAGFERALQEYGVTSRPEWYLQGTGDEEGGAAMARQILGLKQRPTAMVIVNEASAWAFIHQVERSGVHVPQDISIVSNDDLAIARYTTPPLTTVSQPVREIAKAAADLVKSRLVDKYDGPPRCVVVRGQLVERESIRPKEASRKKHLNGYTSASPQPVRA